jgi:hypothetical protein
VSGLFLQEKSLQQIRANTLDELKNLIAQHGDDALFRGQTSYYGNSEVPSVTSSFDRMSCDPSPMMKWCRYAQNVLEVLIGEHVNEHRYVQAILQHYGWRSFFVDCSSSPAVSSWFACHKCVDDPIIELSEDCEEQPVLLLKRMARYNFEEGDGYLYILDKKAALAVGLVDLAALTLEGARPRAVAQEAWLLGPLHGEPVPHACFKVRIEASRAILRDYAFSHGLTETSVLFPPVSEDPILKALLSLPWREVEKGHNPEFDIPVFRRTLNLPEYQESFVKIAWPQMAFFRGVRVADTFDSIEGNHIGGIVITVPEVVLFGTASDSVSMRFPQLEALLDEYGSVTLEIDELIQHERMGHLTLYQKGVGVIQRAPSLYEVCELLVQHPGQELKRAGLNQGWYYRKGGDGLWAHEPHPEECICGNTSVHEGHISAIKIAEAYLLCPESFSWSR